MTAGTLARDSALLIPTWLGPSSQGLVLKIVVLLINRYYYRFKIIMSINKTTASLLALREGFQEDIDLDMGKDVADAMQRAVPPETIK